MKIVVGTYDGGLMGWESDLAADSSGRTLQLTYAFAAHDGSVRSLALNEVAGSTLVSGGSDETIRVFNLKKHKETGSLLEHKAAVTAVEFFRGSHLLSGSQDGIVCVWRTSDWLCMDNMRGHKAAVNSISIHPTGRLALSVAQDGGLIMWDLTKGKPAYSTRLPGPAQRVAWFGGGSHFLVAYDACLAVHSGASGKLLHKCGGSDSTASVGAGVYGTSRICDVAVVSAEAATGVAGGRGSSAAAGESSEVLAYAVCGHESGEVSVWALPQGRQVRRFASGHTKRVRCVAFCDGRTGSPVKSAASAAGGSDGAAVGRSEPSSSLGDDVNPLSKLAAASKLRTVLPAGAGPYLVTADSDGLVKLWNAAEVLGEPAEAAGAGKDAAAPAALATLSAAAGSRITCLAASTHGPSTTAADDAAAGASIGSGSAAAVAAVAGASAGSAGGKPRKVGAKASRPGRHDGGKEAAAAAGAGGVAASTGRTSSPSSGGDGRAQKKQRRGSSAASGVAEATGAPAAAGAKPKPGGGGVRAPSVTVTSKKQRGGGAESAGPPAGGKAKKSVRFG